MVVIPFTEEQFAKIAEKTILDALKLGEAFKSLTADEAMIRFRVPSDIGIGLSASEPITIYYRKELTQIPERYRQPLIEEVWETVEQKMTLRQLRDRGRFRHNLKYMPTDRNRIEMQVISPKYRSGKRVAGIQSFHEMKFTFEFEGAEPIVMADYPDAVQTLKRHKVREADTVTIKLRYPRAKTPDPRAELVAALLADTP